MNAFGVKMLRKMIHGLVQIELLENLNFEH